MYALIPSKILGMDVGTFTFVALAVVAEIAMAFVAASTAERKGHSFTAFMAVGLLLPVVGLIIALVMPPKSAPSSADEIAKYKRLLDDGAITQAEYDKKKREILG